MRRIYYLSIAFLAMLFSVGCQKEDDVLSIDADSKVVEAPGGSFNLTIQSSSGWSIISDQSWCFPVEQSGSSGKTVSICYTKNASLKTRTATLTIKNGTSSKMLTLSQNCEATLNANVSTVKVNAQTDTVSFMVNSSMEWTLTSDQSWCTVSPSTGTESKRVVVTYTANNTSEERVAKLTLLGGDKSFAVSVIQGLKVAADQKALTIMASGTSVALNIKSTLGWEITSDQTWCTPSVTMGTGNMSITVSCLPNFDTNMRTANLSVTCGDIKQTVLVTQNGETALLLENFENNANLWPINETVTASDSILKTLSGGYYIFNNSRKGSYFGSVFKEVLSDISEDFVLESQITLNSGKGGLGIFFGAQNISNTFLFEYSSASKWAGLYKRVSNSWSTTQVQSGLTTISSATNTIKITKIGTNYDFYINGTKVISGIKIDTLFGKSIGLYLERQTEIKIDYLNVYSLN